MTNKKQEIKRLFFGLDLAKNNKLVISNWLAKLLAQENGCYDNLHLTLAFTQYKQQY